MPGPSGIRGLSHNRTLELGGFRMNAAAKIRPGQEEKRAAGVDPRGARIRGAMPCRAAGRRERALGWKNIRRGPSPNPGAHPLLDSLECRGGKDLENLEAQVLPGAADAVERWGGSV